MNILIKANQIAINSIDGWDGMRAPLPDIKKKLEYDNILSGAKTPIITETQEIIVLHKLIGKGTFGQVYIGNIESNPILKAIKKVKIDEKYMNRELEIMQFLVNYSNDNIYDWS